MWKMRSLLFLFTAARPRSESDAMPAVRIAPDLRKVRRVMVGTGVVEGFVFMMGERIMHGAGGTSIPMLKTIPARDMPRYFSVWMKRMMDSICESVSAPA